ncbi:Hypothetical_protein [Hexamita inflata]|uniref:Hypothetical_protein n=1 Tax=Hexamita inflata TaxID=28002 RepID=A0AA86VS47_9EUKA|nr:Hypothetical protein HINF_LOCUS62988 [Hexamita inflata]
MNKLEMRLDMLQQERDNLQQELTVAHDEIFKQRNYIRSCKQIIKNLRPNEELDDNGDLQPIENAQDLRDSSDVIQEVAQKQFRLSSQQQAFDTYLKAIQKQFDSIQQQAKQIQSQAVETDPQMKAMFSECKFFVNEYQKEMKQFKTNDSYKVERDKYEQIINQQRETIQELQNTKVKQQHDIQSLQADLQNQVKTLDQLRLQINLLQNQNDNQNQDQQTLIKALNSYERSLYQNQLDSTSSDPALRSLKMKVQILTETLTASEKNQAQNEQLICFISSQFNNFRRKFTQQLTEISISYKKLYGEIQQKRTQNGYILEQNETAQQSLSTKLTTIQNILQELSTNQLDQLQFEKNNTQNFKILLEMLKAQLNPAAQKPMIERSLDFIEKHVEGYQKTQEELFQKVEDSEKQVNRLRAELLQIQRDALDAKRQNKINEADAEGRFEGLKASVLK